MSETVADSVTEFTGNDEYYGTEENCPNRRPNALFLMYQGFETAAQTNTDYNVNWCTGMRSSTDSKSTVSGYSSGTTIKFAAGYRIFRSST